MKVLMYNFHYNYIKNKHNNKSRLLFTDTDSLMYFIDFSKDKEMFGFGDYSAKSKYYDDSSKLVFGKMKDGTGDIVTEEFVRLKPKMYLFLVDNSSDHKKK